MAIGEKQAGLVLHDKYAGVDPFLHTLPQTGMGGLGLHIERIVAAVQADAHGLVQLLRSAAQRADEQRVCNGREFRRHKLIACALAADAATGNDDGPRGQIGLHAAAGAHTDNGLRSRGSKLLQCGGNAGTAHAAACDGDICAARCFAGIGRKCAPVGRKRGLCEQRGHLAAALRITRQKHNGRGAAQAGAAEGAVRLARRVKGQVGFFHRLLQIICDRLRAFDKFCGFSIYSDFVHRFFKCPRYTHTRKNDTEPAAVTGLLVHLFIFISLFIFPSLISVADPRSSIPLGRPGICCIQPPVERRSTCVPK